MTAKLQYERPILTHLWHQRRAADLKMLEMDLRKAEEGNGRAGKGFLGTSSPMPIARDVPRCSRDGGCKNKCSSITLSS